MQPHRRSIRLWRSQNYRKTPEHVLQHRHFFLKMRVKLHSQLRQRSSGYNGYIATNAGLDETRAVNHGIQRSGTESLGIRARGVRTANLFGYRFGKIAAAAIITVPHSLL